jgi:hypothetical protein
MSDHDMHVKVLDKKITDLSDAQAYLPLVRGGRGFGAACPIVVMEGEAITYASKRPTSGPVTGILAASLPTF